MQFLTSNGVLFIFNDISYYIFQAFVLKCHTFKIIGDGTLLTLYELGERISSVWQKKNDLKIRTDHWQKSYERRIYESVDDRKIS